MKILPYFVIIPLGAAFITALLGKRIKYLSDILANLASLSLLVLSLFSIFLVGNYKVLTYKIGGWASPLGISIVVDALSCFMLLVVNLIGFLVMVYSVSYMRIYTEKCKFYILFILMLAGMNGIIISSDLFNLYIFLELAAICGYALVSFGVEAEDFEAAFRYAIMGSLASIFILLGIALLYSYTSALSMSDVASMLSSKPKGLLISFVSVLFLTGFGLKAAIVPFHAWLPDAHASAPIPVAVLSGILIKTAGIYALTRVFFNILGVSGHLSLVLMILGILSMVVGAILAIAQDDIKRIFAYSSISQIGYIVFALGIASPLAILGGLLHLLNHAIFKSLLFLNAGAIEYATGERRLSKLGGLNKKMPVTGFTSFLGSMGISGIPPLGGFWSKLIIIIAAVEAGYLAFAVIAVLASIITLAYYLRFQSFSFFSRPVFTKIKEIPLTMKLSILILATLSVGTALAFAPMFRPFFYSAVNVLLSTGNYNNIIINSLT